MEDRKLAEALVVLGGLFVLSRIAPSAKPEERPTYPPAPLPTKPMKFAPPTPAAPAPEERAATEAAETEAGKATVSETIPPEIPPEEPPRTPAEAKAEQEARTVSEQDLETAVRKLMEKISEDLEQAAAEHALREEPVKYTIQDVMGVLRMHSDELEAVAKECQEQGKQLVVNFSDIPVITGTTVIPGRPAGGVSIILPPQPLAE